MRVGLCEARCGDLKGSLVDGYFQCAIRWALSSCKAP